MSASLQTAQQDLLILIANRGFKFHEMAELILKIEDLNFTNSKGQTPLMYAARYNDIFAVDLLIKKNVNLDLRDQYGNTALIHAAKHHNAKMCAILVKNGANVNACSHNGNSALMWSLKNGAIIQNPSDINPKRITNFEDHHALHNRRGCSETATTLIEHGADVDIANKNCRTPLMISLSNGRGTYELILSKTNSIEAMDLYSNTVLNFLIQSENIPTVCKPAIKKEIQIAYNKRYDAVDNLLDTTLQIPVVLKEVIMSYANFSIRYNVPATLFESASNYLNQWLTVASNTANNSAQASVRYISNGLQFFSYSPTPSLESSGVIDEGYEFIDIKETKMHMPT